MRRLDMKLWKKWYVFFLKTQVIHCLMLGKAHVREIRQKQQHSGWWAMITWEKYWAHSSARNLWEFWCDTRVGIFFKVLLRLDSRLLQTHSRLFHLTRAGKNRFLGLGMVYLFACICSSAWGVSIADPGEPWGPMPPFAPKIFPKSCSFQAILKEKPHMMSKFGGSRPPPPLGSQRSWTTSWPKSWIRHWVLPDHTGQVADHRPWKQAHCRTFQVSLPSFSSRGPRLQNQKRMSPFVANL